MRKKKWLAALLACAVAVTMLPVTAFAEGTSVSDAAGFEAALEAGGEVTLAQSFEIDSKQDIVVTKPVTLYLNGNTVTKSYGEINHYFITIAEGGSLTIEGDGKLEATDSSYGYGIEIDGNGTLILNGGTIETTQEGITCSYRASGTVEINGGAVTCVGYDSAISLGSAGDFDLIINGGTVSADSGKAIFASGGSTDQEFNIQVSGGTLSSEDWTIYADDGVNVSVGGDASITTTGFKGAILVNGTDTFPSTLTIEGGSIGGDYVAIDIDGTVQMNMTGGDVTTNRGEALEVSDGANADISGGSLITDSTTQPAVSAEQSGTIQITGGEFSSDVSSYAGAGASAKATVTSGDDSTTRYYIGTPKNVGRDVSNKANAGDTVDVVSGDVTLENVPSGVTVSNSGGGTVLVNGTPVDGGGSVVSHRHDWVAAWGWKEDYSGAIVKFVCLEDRTHTASKEATATKTVIPATCTENGSEVYTVEVVQDGKTYTETKTIVLEALGHHYVNGVCTVCGAADPNYTPAITPSVPSITHSDGWEQNRNGEWVYYQNGRRVSGWIEDKGVSYYLDEDYTMVTGWQQLDGKWYYFYTWGGMAEGWVLDGDVWYYLDPESGEMATGWKQLNGKWYYLYSWGGMAEGWAKVNNVWYYLDPASGEMQTGWELVNGKWYYLYESGAMAYNTTVDGYAVGADGAWIQ